MPGEFALIDWIRSQQPPTAEVPLPAGDDMAVMRWKSQDLLLVGVDQVLDGVHFDLSRHTPRQVGRKVMNRNLSDCAAMACLPAGAVATVALPRGATLEFAKELYLGMRQAADAFSCPIIGGDTGSWDGRLVVTVTLLGKSAGLEPVTRAGARPGDLLYVSGPLGGSWSAPNSLRHIEFVPRIELARELAGTGQVSAMIDLSDGLSRDLGHICQMSHVGAVVQASDIPIHADAHALPGDPLQHALNDGEDYELLIAARSPIAHRALIHIGQIVPGPAVWIDIAGQRHPLRPAGWEHSFR